MSCSLENVNPNSPLKKGSPSWSNNWLKKTKSLKHVFSTKQLETLANSQFPNLTPKLDKKLSSDFYNIDQTLVLSDEILLNILSKLPKSQRNPNFLVCKRWLYLQGRLVLSLKVLSWQFLDSGRLISRFPNLTEVDILNGCMISPQNSSILLSNNANSFHIDLNVSQNMFVSESDWLSDDVIDRGLRKLARNYPNLRKLATITGTEMGLLSIAEECPTLQELELHKCSDNALRAIAAFQNLQILKLIGNINGLYNSLLSDIGLTILAQGCERLVKLELHGCEGSFDGIKAIGQCCQMLEELTFCDHKMDDGWLSALSYCENLKSLRFISCKKIDQSPGPDEFLGSCPSLERLHLDKCQLRDKSGVRALFMVCGAARELVIEECWGLDNDVFKITKICRRVKLLSIEGCSLLTTEGLECVILSWNELQNLKVVSCKSIKNNQVSPALSTLFTLLKDLTWSPNFIMNSHISSTLLGSGFGKKGGKFFKKSWDNLKLRTDS